MELIRTPDITTANPEQALLQMRSYLFQLAEQLNYALSTIGNQDDAAIAQAVVAQTKTQMTDIRSLIVKSATIVQKEVERLDNEIRTNYISASDFGTYQEEMNSRIEQQSGVIEQRVTDSINITGVNEQLAGFSSYQARTEGFIRSGYVEEDEQGLPVIGIAIGETLKTEEVEKDGVTYTKIDPNQSCAFYTAKRLSFRVNGREVAYFSQNALHCGDIEIGGKATLGGKWEIKTTDHLTIRWIGG